MIVNEKRIMGKNVRTNEWTEQKVRAKTKKNENVFLSCTNILFNFIFNHCFNSQFLLATTSGFSARMDRYHFPCKEEKRQERKMLIKAEVNGSSRI